MAVLTSTEAITNAMRLLSNAELEVTNLQLMDALIRASEIWVQIATHLRDNE